MNHPPEELRLPTSAGHATGVRCGDRSGKPERRLVRIVFLAGRRQADIHANLSILKTNKARAIRFSTLEALCKELNCQPGDLLEWTE